MQYTGIGHRGGVFHLRGITVQMYMYFDPVLSKRARSMDRVEATSVWIVVLLCSMHRVEATSVRIVALLRIGIMII